jgi:proteasome lid subunit RPN8/RPN11
MMIKILVPTVIVEQTLAELQTAGTQGHERVVLWLGSKSDNKTEIKEVFVPLQQNASDYFRIPREGMAELMKHLRESNLIIAAQVHSHPAEAFHSQADDYWAIVRHVGALSLVLPYFALRTDRESFAVDAAPFELSETNEWIEVPMTQILMRYSIIP